MRKHQPIIAPGGIARFAMVIVMIFATYWTAQGLKLVIYPAVEGLFALAGIRKT